MKLHILQHVPFESEAAIAFWSEKRNHEISRTRFFLDEKLPSESAFDWLIVMGGPMNVYEVSEYPYLIEEKKFIGNAISQGKKVLGICLGAQLIADVIGGKVYKNHEKEIGWFNVNAIQSPEAEEIWNGIPDNPLVLQWHGDTFDIPPGGVLLAKSTACQNQAFSYRKNVLALQFHLEMTEKSLELIINNCRNEIKPAKYIQSAEQMLGNSANFEKSNQYLEKLLDNFAGLK